MIKTASYHNKAEPPYTNLATAIVERAVIDYRSAVKSKDYAEVKSLRKFFRSEWFKMLCDIDGELIIRTLDMEVAA